MIPRHALAAAALSAAFVALPLAAEGRPRELTPAQRAGRALYRDGRSASGEELRAFVAGTSLPASLVSCATCHGADGLGRPEGGVLPPAITWPELTKRQGHLHPGGRRHAAFDARTVVRAITRGTDPAGNALDPAMPRYSLSRQDAENLVAYLRVLEHDRDPGIAPGALTVATLLPARGPLAEVGEAIRGVLAASFEELNAEGGIHGRRVALEVIAWDPERGGPAAALRARLAADPPFALVSGLAPGAEDEVAGIAERERVPLVAPFTTATASAPAGRYAFHALAGVREQARALARYAARDAAPARVAAVLHAPGGALAEAASAAARDLRAAGLERVEVLELPPGAAGAPLAERLRDGGAEVVLLVAPDAEVAAFTRHAGALGWAPTVLAPGTLAARAAAGAPASFDGRILLAFPSLPGGDRPGALEALARLRARAGLADRARAAQLSAAAAARLLAEGLRRSGRALGRERLVEALEELHAFDPGFAPPLTFRRGRRVGALGAWIVAVDARAGGFTPSGGWVGLE